MRYSNVHESFSDFIKSRKEKETQNIITRIQNFLNNNPQYGYDVKHLLPGLCPVKKMAESIVVTEKYLRNFIKSINYDTMKLFRVNSKIWKGDLVALMPTENSKSKSFKSSFTPNIESFYDYLNDLESYRKPRRYKRKSYSNYPYDYGKSFVSESFFSDFMSWIKGTETEKEDVNYDYILFQVTHFLVKYPGYDYDKLNDTPGFVFLTTLADAIQVPYNSLLQFFKNGKLDNSELINFKMSGIEGPVVIFGKPPVERKTQWDSWNTELTSKSEDEIQDMADVADSVEKDIEKQETKIEPEKREIEKEEEIITNITIDENTLSKIAKNSSETFLNVVLKKVKRDSASPKQTMLMNIFDSLQDQDKTKLLEAFFEDLFKNQLDYLKSSSISDKLFEEKNNVKVLKSDLSNEVISVIISNFVWSDQEALSKLIQFYKSTEKISDSDKIDTEKETSTVAPEKVEEEPSSTENIMRTAKLTSKVLEQLKLKVSDDKKELSTILKDASNDDVVVAVIKNIIHFLPQSTDEMKKNLTDIVFKEYKNAPNTYYIIRDIDSASQNFSKYILETIPDYFLQKYNESKAKS